MSGMEWLDGVARAIREAPMRDTGVKPDPDLPMGQAERLRGKAAISTMATMAGLDVVELQRLANAMISTTSRANLSADAAMKLHDLLKGMARAMVAKP